MTRFFVMRLFVALSLLVAFLSADRVCAQSQSSRREGRAAPAKAQVFLTTKDSGDRLADKGAIAFEPLAQPDENFPTIFVDPARSFQTIEGFGGAFTDAAAETFFKLPPAIQNEFIAAYFDPEKGIGYSLGRTNINSCDFSSDSYTYVEPGDAALKTFSIAHDLKYKVPFIKRALGLVKDLRLFASPWSPPAWMKTNGDMLHGGKLKPEYFDSWARYYVRFIEEYRKQGVPIWGLTVQNEPMAVQTWESCIYTAEEERDFVKNHLGPTLRKSGMNDVRLMIWDHNRGIMYQRASAVLEDPEAAKYVWGTGFHWYVGDHFDNVRMVHEAFPDKQLLFTEGCGYPFSWDNVRDWKWGEVYAKSMIMDLNNWAVGWTDWNLLLDERGGPNHVDNFCLAPVIGDTRDGSLHYMDSYYYIGHISKFVRPGAKRISCSSSSDDLLATAFRNPSGRVAVVVLNATGDSREFQVWVEGKAAKSLLPAHSIATVVF
jgi:glucosylceramidase